LNGEWRLTHTVASQRCDLGAVKKQLEWAGSIPAVVPGDVHLDLMREGLISDPFFGLNADHCRWMEQKDWWYVRLFSVPEELKGKNMYLVFDGLDCFAEVYLNDELIGASENMFVPLEIDVTRKVVLNGENELIVKLGSPIFSAPIPAELPEYVGGNDLHATYTRKAAMSYSWDIAPRLLTIGIWKNVTLTAYESARINDVHIRTAAIETNKAELIVSATIEKLESRCVSTDVKLDFASYSTSKRVTLEQQYTMVEWKLAIDDVRLWWPNGLGNQHLYDWKVSLEQNSKAIDTRDGRYGVRKIELLQEPRNDGGRSFYFKINDQPIFMKGLNWSPADALFARMNDRRYHELLSLLKDAHVNMLRCCGVGIYEDDAFYDYCDEMGILVWQDFMFSGSVWPQEKGFVDNVKREITHHVMRLRSRTCLALWCGDNEVDGWEYKNRQKLHPYANTLNKKVIPDILRELDPERIYRPSCAGSYDFDAEPNSDKEGDFHSYVHGHHFTANGQYDVRPSFVSETGYISCPDEETLRLFLSPEFLWPTANEQWHFHASDTMRRTLFTRANHYRIKALHDAVKAHYNTDATSLEDFIEKTQQIQADCYKAYIEHFREMDCCGGILLWNVADCWPQISDSIISYPCRPKKAYYAVKEAFGKIGNYKKPS